MKTVRRIELLAPAKNVEIGQQAILHGADAVYIGAVENRLLPDFDVFRRG